MKYFDNAATSPLLPEVKQFIIDNLDVYGNPSSLHGEGYKAKEMLENARSIIAEYIHANPEDIYFCSSGTEANTQALHTGSLRTSNIITSSFEHPAVDKTADYLFDTVEKIVPNINGVVNINDFDGKLDNDKFISIMHVNNELGSIQPIKEVVNIAHDNGCIVHSDMVQSIGHIPVDIKHTGVDMASMSGHKFGAPRGIAALYCNTENNIFPFSLLKGGLQERGYRAGTENVIGAAAMALALKISVDNLEKNTNKIIELRWRLLAGVLDIKDIKLNGSMTSCVPGIINVSFKGLKGDEIQSMLDDRGIAISTGSACHSGVSTPSSTLVSIDVPEEYLHSAIRISISHMNTMSEVEYFIKNLKEVVEILRKY